MLEVRTKNFGTVSILCLEGRIVIGATAPLRNALGFPLGITMLVLDFARVSTVDAAGLGVLLELRQETHAKGVGFKLMNLTKRISQLLEITRLNSVFEVTSAAELSGTATFGRRVTIPQLAPCASSTFQSSIWKSSRR